MTKLAETDGILAGAQGADYVWIMQSASRWAMQRAERCLGDEAVHAHSMHCVTHVSGVEGGRQRLH